MKISDLNPEYDKLQQEYGAKELRAIYNGGCTNNPDICFVFMNPTGRNIASSPNWKGRRSPWIGTKNIWKLFNRIGFNPKIIWCNNHPYKFIKIIYNLQDIVGYIFCCIGNITKLF